MYKTRSALVISRLVGVVVLVSLIFAGFQMGGIDTARAQEQFTSAQLVDTAHAGIQTLAADGSSFYYYADGQRIPLAPSLSWVSVKFTSAYPAEQSAALRNSADLLGSLDQARRIPKPELTLLPVQPDVTVQALVQGINSMRAMPASFTAVNPVFQTADAEMAITDQFVATFPDGKNMEDINAINSAHGVEIVEPILGQDNTFVLKIAAGARLDALAVANLYQESGLAVSAAPNFVRIVQSVPQEINSENTAQMSPLGGGGGANDYWYFDQWHLNNTQQYGTGTTYDADIDALEAWAYSSGSSSIIIAVIDEGVDLTHEDLSGKLVTGYDATGWGSAGAPWGNDAHGTNVAGLAAAMTNNTIGVAGVCPNCLIMPVRIAYSDAYGDWVAYDSWIANGITWAYQNGASILNNSWGGGSSATVINTAFSNAKTLGRGGKGSVIVVSAGNNNSSTVLYPASLSTVIAVGASNMCDQRKTPTNDLCNGYENWWGSNYGTALDISAPGVWLYSTDIMGAAGYSTGNYFNKMNGTSGAAPIVSGVAGLILSLRSSLTADQVQTILQNTADDVNSISYPGWDQYMGYGRVNANRAVQAAMYPYTPASQGTASFGLANGWTVQNSVRTIGDVNGGGWADLIGFGLNGVYVAISNGTGFGSASQWSTAFGSTNGWTVDNSVRTAGDVNNDGRADLVGFGYDGVYVATSTGIGFGSAGQWSTAFGSFNGWTVQNSVRTVGDVNNDGRVDLIGFGLDGVYVATSTGSGFGAVSQWSTAFGLANSWTVQNSVRTVGDVNNDGRVDLIGFGYDGVYIALSTGSGFGSANRWSTGFGSFNGWTVENFVRTVGDVNNDRRADLIGFGLDGVYVALAPSTGSIFGTPTQWSQDFDLSHGWTVQGFVRTLGDTNNDGKADLIGFGQDGVYVGTAR